MACVVSREKRLAAVSTCDGYVELMTFDGDPAGTINLLPNVDDIYNRRECFPNLCATSSGRFCASVKRNVLLCDPSSDEPVATVNIPDYNDVENLVDLGGPFVLAVMGYKDAAFVIDMSRGTTIGQMQVVGRDRDVERQIGESEETVENAYKILHDAGISSRGEACVPVPDDIREHVLSEIDTDDLSYETPVLMLERDRVLVVGEKNVSLLLT